MNPRSRLSRALSLIVGGSAVAAAAAAVTLVPVRSSGDVAATVKGVRTRVDPLFGPSMIIDVAVDGRIESAANTTTAMPRPGSKIVLRRTETLVGLQRLIWDGKALEAAGKNQ